MAKVETEQLKDGPHNQESLDARAVAEGILETGKREQAREAQLFQRSCKAFSAAMEKAAAAKHGAEYVDIKYPSVSTSEELLLRHKQIVGDCKKALDGYKAASEAVSGIIKNIGAPSGDPLTISDWSNTPEALFAALAEVRQIAARTNVLTGLQNEVLDQYQKAVIKEAGFQSKEELDKKLEEPTSKDKSTAKHFFRKLSSRRYRNKLVDEAIERGRLRDYQEKYRQISDADHVFFQANPADEFETIRNAARKFFDSTLEFEDARAKDAIGRFGSEKFDERDEALLAGVERKYIDKILIPGFKEELKKASDNSLGRDSYGNASERLAKIRSAKETESEAALKLAEEGMRFSTGVTQYGGSAEEREAQRVFEEKKKKLPEVLKRAVQETMSSGAPVHKLLGEAVMLVQHAEERTRFLDIAARRRTMLTALKGFATENTRFFEEGAVGRMHIDVGYRDAGDIYGQDFSAVYGRIDKMIAELEPEALDLAMQDPGLTEEVPPGNFALADELMKGRIYGNILARQGDKESAWTWTRALLHRKNLRAEDAPVAIFANFRQAGGINQVTYRNRGDISPLGEALVRLEPAQVDGLKQLDIPGLAELVHTVRQYPETFGNPYLYRSKLGPRYPDGSLRALDNPITKNIDKNVMAMVGGFIVNDNETAAQELALRSLGGLRYETDWTEELYGSIEQAVIAKPELALAAFEVLFSKFHTYDLSNERAMQAVLRIVQNVSLGNEAYECAVKKCDEKFVDFKKNATEKKEYLDKHEPEKREAWAALELRGYAIHRDLMVATLEKIAARIRPEAGVEPRSRFRLSPDTVLALANTLPKVTPGDGTVMSIAEELVNRPEPHAILLGVYVLTAAGKSTLELKDKILPFIQNWELHSDPNMGLGSEANQIIGDLVIKFGREGSAQERAELADTILQIPEGKAREAGLNALNFLLCEQGIYNFTQKNLPKLLEESKGALNEKSWAQALAAYIEVQENPQALHENGKKLIDNLFSTGDHPENASFALAKLREQWGEFLSGRSEHIPFELMMLCYSADKAGGVGQLKYIEALGDLVISVRRQCAKSTTAERTKKEIKAGLAGFEQVFAEGKKIERWSEDEKAGFYHLSNEVITAAPSLYTDFLKVFEALSPREDKEFSRDLFPLYHGWIVLLQKTNAEGEVTGFAPRDLVAIRTDIRTLADSLRAAPSPEDRARIFEEARVQLIEILKTRFKARFGIIAVPEKFTDQNIRTLRDTVLYLANMSNKTPHHEAVLGFYLALRLNDKWEAFRSGEVIDPAMYVDEEKVKIIAEFLKERTEKNILTPELLGISPAEMADFHKILQDETISMVIGNVQTIDVRLGSAKRNLESLADEDAYPEAVDKALVRASLHYGKKVGSALAKAYRAGQGTVAELDSEERTIVAAIAASMEKPNLSTEDISAAQKRLKLIGPVASMIDSLEKAGVDEGIAELQRRLTSPAVVVDIFNRLGESFSVSSGAFALSQDLSYLENIIVKHDQDLKPDEKEILHNYLNKIREQMQLLESYLDKVKESFTAVKRSLNDKASPVLADRLKDIEQALYAPNDSTELTTRVTNDLNLIIENIRACLGCKRKEQNNDTNVTFGESNKFFIISQAEGLEKSVADQIVLLAPLALAEGQKSQEVSFVIDKLYGAHTGDVLLGHVVAIQKKYDQLVSRFPNIKLSIFVTKIALESAGLTDETLAKKLLEKPVFGVEVSSIKGTVDIPKSAAGDHYLEFHSAQSDCRGTGPRNVEGLRLVRKAA